MTNNGRHRATTLVEILIALLLFSFGVLLLFASITYSLDTIIGSRTALKTDQEISNSVEKYLISRAIKHNKSAVSEEYVPNNGTVTPVQTDKSFNLCGAAINYTIYKFDINDKSSPFYIMEKR